MAMQSGIGFSKIIILVGAGYTSTLLLNNGKLSELLREIRGDEAEGDYADAIAGQVRRLAMEVRQLASARQITVLNGGSSVDVTSLVVPAAALGTLGYGYMWWKGLSFSDLMYVTKSNITNAVSNLKNNLEQVSDAIAAAKKHLTQRIENLDGKMDEQVERSKLIRSEVTDVHDNLSQLGYNLDSLKEVLAGMDGKMMTLEEKQDFTRHGVQYLCNKFDGNMISHKTQDRFKLAGKSFGGYISSGGTIALEGVKEIPDILDPCDVNNLLPNGILENCTPGSKKQSRMLTRRNTVKVNV
ncbi:hypothetical protein L1987_81319 [Smallanthus sonchifolius]|uniref:Uncharacterized protein n=1 Tax=Smallanthus sonchifolius TaxID=185202 RepID=A0ACB8YQK5_9ASTR|nr:hypothetical protein L1987_81319 [Smallanthus sonchifolius]